MTLSHLFPDGDYRFQLGLRRGSPEEFFRPANPELLRERERWLKESPTLYSALLPEGEALLAECRELAEQWGSLPGESQTKGEAAPAFPEDRCRRLGKLWEPDFLLVKSDSGFPLLGGCVCFPSSWSLEGKPGRPLSGIHAPVPGLNAAQGRGIEAVLGKMTPGGALFRHNWGLSRSGELNQHPSRELPRLDAAVSLAEVWLRVEHQALVALPRSGGILFGIRIAMHPLTEVKSDSGASSRLARALRSMPEDVAAYKGLSAARGRLAALLDQES